MCNRCKWVNLKNQLYVQYHDEQWGVPVHCDDTLFEMLTLEGAQAGLSWETILKRRENYRTAFDDFNVQKISMYGDAKIQELLANAGIIRNKLKIKSVINNAKVFMQIQAEFGSFDAYLWNYVENKQIHNSFTSLDQVPAKTALSDALAKDLKKRGMSFVGSTIMYAFMQSIGMVNDHMTDCFRYKEIKN